MKLLLWLLFFLLVCICLNLKAEDYSSIAESTGLASQMPFQISYTNFIIGKQ